MTYPIFDLENLEILTTKLRMDGVRETVSYRITADYLREIERRYNAMIEEAEAWHGKPCPPISNTFPIVPPCSLCIAIKEAKK